MNQQNEVNTTQEMEKRQLEKKYGAVPVKKNWLQNKLKERKYFDSGDYALSKAGKASDIGVTNVGREHPVPEKIPHIAPPAHVHNGQPQNGLDKGTVSGSPVKENTFLHRETSLHRETTADEIENAQVGTQGQNEPKA